MSPEPKPAALYLLSAFVIARPKGDLLPGCLTRGYNLGNPGEEGWQVGGKEEKREEGGEGGEEKIGFHCRLF